MQILPRHTNFYVCLQCNLPFTNATKNIRASTTCYRKKTSRAPLNKTHRFTLRCVLPFETSATAHKFLRNLAMLLAFYKCKKNVLCNKNLLPYIKNCYKVEGKFALEILRKNTADIAKLPSALWKAFQRGVQRTVHDKRFQLSDVVP